MIGDERAKSWQNCGHFGKVLRDKLLSVPPTVAFDSSATVPGCDKWYVVAEKRYPQIAWQIGPGIKSSIRQPIIVMRRISS